MTSPSKGLKALVDSDILVYRVGFTTQEEDEGIARWRLNDFIDRMKDTLETNDVQHFLTSTDKSNFRFQLFPDYKANRTQPKPKHYQFLRDTLVYEYGAKEVFGQEADDQLGIEQRDNTVICTIDKDLNQIPGWHFDFVKGRLFNISPLEAIRCFYDQVLVGDKSTDNIEGCPKIGKVRAGRILDGCQNELEMLEAVVSCYVEAYPPKVWAEKLLLAGSLLWIRRKPNQGWQFGNQSLDSKETLEAFWKSTQFPLHMNQGDMSFSFQNSSDTTLQTSK